MPYERTYVKARDLRYTRNHHSGYLRFVNRPILAGANLIGHLLYSILRRNLYHKLSQRS